MDKDFTTLERQIEILKERDLQFVSEEMAKKALQRFGYYSIINGYKDPYICQDDNGEEKYVEGVTFEQIFSLYHFDKNIRIELLGSMLEIEEMLRAAVAHTISESFTADQNLYLKRENYRSGKNRDGVYQIDEILNKFQKIMSDDVQPIKHYRETYHNVPPWILLKGASFGNLVNFVKLLKGPQKNRIISIMYDVPIELVKASPVLKDLFMDTLFVCLDYRNRAAHGGRIYNFESKSKFRYSSLLHNQMEISEADYRHGRGTTGLVALCHATQFFDNKDASLKLVASTNYFFEEHCKLYPDDKFYLERYLYKI